MRIHADVEIEHDEDDRLQPLGEIERARGELERLVRPVGNEQHVLGVAVRGEGAAREVGLLGARRHAGRGPAALHVEHHHRNLGEIGEAEELLHQRDAGPGGRGEGARAVPARSDRDADGGDLVLGLNDGVVLLACRLVDPVARAIALERFRERRGGRDRVPGADGGPAIDGAEAGGKIALDENPVADGVAAPEPNAERTLEAGLRLVVADLERLQIGGDQLVLALELLADQRLDDLQLDVEQRRERADVDDVLVELALPRIVISGSADRGQRQPEDLDVVAGQKMADGPRRIVEEIAAGLERRDILREGLRIHGDQNIGASARAEPDRPRSPALRTRWAGPDVRGEDVARRDRHAHPQDRPRKQQIGACRSRAVDVGEANDEVVYSVDRHRGPACAISMVNFIMSQAPVGQRSAQSPQCRQRSSSLTITRRVLTGSET